LILDSGLLHVALLSNHKAEQIQNKLSLEGWRRGETGRVLPEPTRRANYTHSTQVPCVKVGKAKKLQYMPVLLPEVLHPTF